MTSLPDLEVWDFEAQQLARHLLSPYPQGYESFRNMLIERYGYDAFRDIQRDAFQHALHGKVTQTARPTGDKKQEVQLCLF